MAGASGRAFVKKVEVQVSVAEPLDPA